MEEWTKDEFLEQLKRRAEGEQGKKTVTYEKFRELIFEARFPQCYFQQFRDLFGIIDDCLKAKIKSWSEMTSFFYVIKIKYNLGC